MDIFSRVCFIMKIQRIKRAFEHIQHIKMITANVALGDLLATESCVTAVCSDVALTAFL